MLETIAPFEIDSYYGLNTKLSRAKLPPGFSPDTTGFHDVDLSQPGVAKTRGGSVTINKDHLLAYAPVRIFDYYKPSTNTHTIIGNGGTKVYTMTLLGVPTDIGSGFTDGEVMDFLNYKDSVYYSNGVDPGRVWDGTTERLWGIVAPTSANTFAADSAGGLTGDYQYAYTYFDSVNNGESSASPFSAVHTVSTATINLTGLIASTDPQVDKIRIYRTTNGGALFLLVATINNGVTTYADNTTDVDLGTEELPIYNDVPGLFVGLEEWDGRIWGYEKNSTKVMFSNDEFLTPAGQGIPWESFGADNFIDFNLKVYGIKKSPNFNELWVHTSGGIYAITRTGIASDPYTPEIRNSTWFTEAHLSIVNIYNDQWFITANNKWMAIDSSGYLSYKSYNIEPTIELLNKTKRPFIQAVHYRSNSKNQFRAVYADGANTTFSKMIAANYLQQTPATDYLNSDAGVHTPVWEYHNIASTAIGIVKDSNEEDILYTGTSDGRIVKQDIGTDDDGVAIDWSMNIGWLRGAATNDVTVFPRFLLTNYKPLGNWFFSMRTDFDFGNSGGQVYSIKSAPTGDRFDIDFIFDVSKFAGEQDLGRVCTDLGGDYKYAEITWFGNVLGQVFEMHNNTLLSRPVEGFRR
jgi:hypothetical protein